MFKISGNYGDGDRPSEEAKTRRAGCVITPPNIHVVKTNFLLVIVIVYDVHLVSKALPLQLSCSLIKRYFLSAMITVAGILISFRSVVVSI